MAACVAELAALDANSTVFRYAERKDGHTPVLPEEQLDIVNLRVVMNGMEIFSSVLTLNSLINRNLMNLQPAYNGGFDV